MPVRGDAGVPVSLPQAVPAYGTAGRPAALISGYQTPSSPVERMIRSWSKQVAFSIGSGAGSRTERGKGAVVKRSREADAFLTAIDQTAPEAVSACDGWTTHEIAVHVAGIAVEVIRHLEPYLQGDPVPQTRSFEEREAPLQAIGHPALLSRLDAEEERMRCLAGDVLDREPDAVIPWTGRRMAVAKFIPHLRNEHALHRWDIAGDDETSRQLLGGMDLVDHSVGELGRILLVAGRAHDPYPDSEFHARLRTEGQPDLRVIVENGNATLAWASDEADEPSVDIDAGARQLFIWGRRPDHRGRLRSHLTQPGLARLQALLSGY